MTIGRWRVVSLIASAILAVAEISAMAKITSDPVAITASAGDTIQLPCNVSDQGDHVVVWRRGGRRVLTAGRVLVTSDPRLTLTSANSLQITQLQAEDQDTYSCSLDTEQLQEVVHQLNVLFGPIVSVRPESGTVIVQQGDSANMSCEARGRPPPHIQWRKQSGLLSSGRLSVSSRDFHLTHVSRHHAGVYQCTAESSRGLQTATIVLHVRYAPEVTTTQQTVYSAEGREAIITCHVISDPPAQLVWSRVNTVMELNRHTLSKSEDFSADVYSLRIHPVRSQDFGQYRCLATNSLGENSQLILLSGAPENVEITSQPVSVKSSQYQLEWRVTSYSPILEYMLTVRPKRNTSGSLESKWKMILVPSIGGSLTDGMTYSQHVVLNDLKPSRRHEVRVQARNKHGWSKYSSIFVFSTMPSGAALESRPDDPATVPVSSYRRSTTWCDPATVLTLLLLTFYNRHVAT